PDVTVVTPVFAQALRDVSPGDARSGQVMGQSDAPQTARATVRPADAGTILFFTASRAHHAEIGGITPGSMPPFSKHLAEEGVLIQHFRLVQQAQSSEDELRRLLTSGPYPSRSVHENIADINAQVAANQVGVTQLLAMVERHGLSTVHAYMGHI